jgi:glycine dehydrogenase subunit 1
VTRYIGLTDADRKAMLAEIGVSDIRDLFSDVPDSVLLNRKLDLPNPLSEMEVIKRLKTLAEKNIDTDHSICFLGAGAYDHFIPANIGALMSRQEFYTAYTPYQPEISQGTLQAIFEYQTLICQLTGMDVANASMYDGATSLTEAAILAVDATNKKEVLVAANIHPESLQVLKTYANFRDIKVTEVSCPEGQMDLTDLRGKLNENIATVILQNPNFFGIIEEVDHVAELAHQNNSLLIVSADPISLGLLKSPGELGADIVVGEGQSLGNQLNYGGPYLGFFAAKEKWMRKMPGRIVGQTVDKEGRRGFVLTLQTREQHIRREKATSNICSNQGLNALAATMYLTFLGKNGLKEVAELCLQKAHYTYDKLLSTGKFKAAFEKPFFKEFAVISQKPVEGLNRDLQEEGFIGGYPLERNFPEMKNGWLVSVTEKRTKEEIISFVREAAE